LEKEKETQKYEDLEEEAQNSNRYEQAQRNFEETGFTAQPEAFLPKQCRHEGRRAIATQIVIDLDDATQEEVVFEIRETKCLECGKSLRINHQRLFYSQEQINSLRNAIRMAHFGNRGQNGGEI